MKDMIQTGHLQYFITVNYKVRYTPFLKRKYLFYVYPPHIEGATTGQRKDSTNKEFHLAW